MENADIPLAFQPKQNASNSLTDFNILACMISSVSLGARKIRTEFRKSCLL